MNLSFPKIYHLAQTNYNKQDLIELSEEFTEKVDGIQFWLGKLSNGEVFIKTKTSPPLTKEICLSQINWLKSLSLDIFLNYFDKLNEKLDSNTAYVFEYVAHREPPPVIKYSDIPFLVFLFSSENNFSYDFDIIEKLNNIFYPEIKVFSKHYLDYRLCIEIILECQTNEGVEFEDELGILFKKNIKSAYGADYIEGVVIRLSNNEIIKVVPNSFTEERISLWKETDEKEIIRKKILNTYFKTDFFKPRQNPKILNYLVEKKFRSFEQFVNFFAIEVIKENSKLIPGNLLDFINSKLKTSYDSLEEVIKDFYKFKLAKVWNIYVQKFKKI